MSRSTTVTLTVKVTDPDDAGYSQTTRWEVRPVAMETVDIERRVATFARSLDPQGNLFEEPPDGLSAEAEK